jgi:2-keto-3-deoxy-L-rhamnonate aldolase RhmA
MKTEAVSRIRQKLQSDSPILGLRITLDAAAIADIAAGLGFDWICVDLPSGALDWQEVREPVRATARSQTAALVRLADSSPELIAAAQALGADGVLIPCPARAADLEGLLMHFRKAHSEADAQARFIIAPVIRDACTTEDLKPFAAINGTDFFVIDRSLGDSGENDNFAQLVLTLRNAGKHAGVFATSREELQGFLSRKCTVIAVGTDVSVLRTEIQAVFKTIDRHRGS